MKLLFTNEWLRKRTESDPDDAFCGAGYEPDHEGALVDDAFYCMRCGQPINRNSDGSDTPSSGGMCGVCASTGTVIA